MTGPEQATPESYELQNKTVYYTDDIMPIPLDANKLKRIVAGEEQSGRPLWGKPGSIHPRGKVLWTSNFDPNGPGEDNAYWERASYLPMLTKYVPAGGGVDPTRYRFEQNHVRYQKLLEKRNGFFSVTVKALATYYQSLEWDSIKRQPATLSSFPLPKVVETAVSEARARALPLAAFMKEYTKTGTHPLEYVKIEDLFQNYMLYLDNVNEQRTKRNTTQTSFVALLASSLEINCAAGAVDGRMLVKKVVRRSDYSFESHQDAPIRGDYFNFAEQRPRENG